MSFARLALLPGLIVLGLPGCTGESADGAERPGWSAAGLRRVVEQAEAFGSAALLIESAGRTVLAHGDLTTNFRAHSMRKSLLSALYGIYIEEGSIDTSKSMGDLRIEELTPLTEVEKQATVLDLLEARSGIYLPAASEVDSMREARPARGSQVPGTFWYYNNWDFNVLGTIFMQETGEDLFAAFQRRIAEPIGMRDFSLENTRYQQEEVSVHPSYKFRISARDLARFGTLYLDHGRWEGRQIVPAAWLEESLSAHSRTDKESGYGKGTKSGFGYMWWIAAVEGPDARGIPRGTVTASGSGGQRLVLLPDIDTVVVHLMNTDIPDGPRIRSSEFDRLLRLILEARID